MNAMKLQEDNKPYIVFTMGTSVIMLLIGWLLTGCMPTERNTDGKIIISEFVSDYNSVSGDRSKMNKFVNKWVISKITRNGELTNGNSEEEINGVVNFFIWGYERNRYDFLLSKNYLETNSYIMSNNSKINVKLLLIDEDNNNKFDPYFFYINDNTTWKILGP